MTSFIVIAALMAAIAASAVAWPLLRDRRSRLQGAIAGLLVMGLAAFLYPRWSNFDWHAETHAPPVASPEVLAMVARLEQRMRAQPNEIQGWLMLGRSYMALERFEDAVGAYEHAVALDGKSPEALLGLGEALSMRAGGNIPPPAAELFERAVTLAPEEPKALLYGGYAAALRGDRALARARWQALKDLHPPAPVAAILDQRIAELGPVAPASGPVGAATAAPSSASADAGAPAGPADTSAQATVTLSIAPQLRSKLSAETPLFVFAREPGAAGPPLAVKRLTSAAIGSQVRLSAADSMVPGRVLTAGQRVFITARVSFSGQPLPAAGDLYGELSYEVGRDGVRDLVIDHVAE